MAGIGPFPELATQRPPRGRPDELRWGGGLRTEPWEALSASPVGGAPPLSRRLSLLSCKAGRRCCWLQAAPGRCRILINTKAEQCQGPLGLCLTRDENPA